MRQNLRKGGIGLVDLIVSIEEIEKLIFAYDIKTAMNKITELTDDLISISGKLNPAALNQLIGIMNSMNLALTNKDYLLFNDTLHFSLIPFLEANIL
jgi:hypothetical protein